MIGTKRRTPGMIVAGLAVGFAGTAAGAPKNELRLMTIDPGHFHAALVHRDSYPDVSPRVDIYAPVGMDLIDHLKRVARFNLRPDNPTAWQIEVHTGPDFFARMKKERPGNIVVISGKNRGKIDYIQGSISAGFHVLVDKPWILRSEDLPRLKATLDAADKTGRIALDLMTERFEISSLLQKELVSDPEIFGQIQPGTSQQPSVYMESVHHLMKVVSGVPNIRPTWFFDTAQQGEGLNDIGTHLVDLVSWTLFPTQALDAEKDIKILSAQRWPTLIPRANFQRVTGEKDFPDFLAKDVKADALEYFSNTLVTYAVRGVHTRLNIVWDWEAPAGSGDRHFAFYKGTRARIEIRQGKAEKFRPEVYVVPNDPKDGAAVLAAVRKRLGALQSRYPGVALQEAAGEGRLDIPDRLRTVHEEHFAQVARRFFDYVKTPGTMPAWEKSQMLAKYYVTTRGTDLSRLGPVKVAERLGPK